MDKIINTMKQEEHNIQCACVRWFNLQWPQYRGLLFSVPNGGARCKATAGRLKAEGVYPGVADLILLVPSIQHVEMTRLGEFEMYVCHGLCIEMKTPKGRQSPAQKLWQYQVEMRNYKYIIVRSLDEFINTINNYLQ